MRAALEQWKQAPNFEIIEAELVPGACSFKGGVCGQVHGQQVNKFTVKAGTEEKFLAVCEKLPAAGMSGSDFMSVFK